MDEPQATPASTDDPFAELFPSDDGNAPTTATGDTEPPATLPQAAPPAEPDFFLKTGTGSVYKSKDDAIRGIETKDQTIETLRARVIAREGIDPLTGRPVTPEPQTPASYLADRKRYFKDLQAAATRGDEEAYMQAQMQLVQDVVAPYLPLVVEGGRDRALRSLPEPVRQFVDSPNFDETLKDYPTLQNAIQAASQTPQMFGQLPELYKLAFTTYQAKGLAPAGSSPTPPPRTATPPSTLTPPTQVAASPSLESKDGRQAIIKRATETGLADMRF